MKREKCCGKFKDEVRQVLGGGEEVQGSWRTITDVVREAAIANERKINIHTSKKTRCNAQREVTIGKEKPNKMACNRLWTLRKKRLTD